MKTITIQIKDETAEALDKVAELSQFYKYPIEQAYSLIIDEIVRDLQNVARCSYICGCGIPEHQHPPAWCF